MGSQPGYCCLSEKVFVMVNIKPLIIIYMLNQIEIVHEVDYDINEFGQDTENYSG
jgi:hypothetical protein